MKSASEAILDLTDEELHAWKSHMEGVLAEAPADLAILGTLIVAYVFVRRALRAARVSIARLMRLFGVRRTEKSEHVLSGGLDQGQQPSDGSDRPGDAGGATGGQGQDPAKKKRKKPAKGHGRTGADAYTGGVRIPIRLEWAFRGCLCPGCKKGKLTPQKPGTVLRIFGQALLIAKIWEPERWRCSLCKAPFRAPLPAEAGGPTYDATAAAMLAIAHFGNGLPFHRLAQLQASMGIPAPASVQSEVLRDAHQGLRPVVDALIRYAAQCDIVHNDDTGMKILSLLKIIKQHASTAKKGKARTGIFTTGIVALKGARRVALFFIGRRHAGENLAAVLAHRDPSLPPPIHVSDGLDRNAPGTIKTEEGKCLTHGRRLFVDIVGSFPEACRRVVEDLKQVYHVDAIAKRRNLSPEDRLLLHQEKSGPVMGKLRRWMSDQLQERFVESNSPLGGAMIYMLKRWDKLTLFLRKAGAPLDNNICEQSLKKAIRYRKNSSFYKTEAGAAIGDGYMTLIETCILNKVDAYHYLVSLLKNVRRLKDSPESWLPWNYRAMLQDPGDAVRVPETVPQTDGENADAGGQDASPAEPVGETSPGSNPESECGEPASSPAPRPETSTVVSSTPESGVPGRSTATPRLEARGPRLPSRSDSSRKPKKVWDIFVSPGRGKPGPPEGSTHSLEPPDRGPARRGVLDDARPP